MISLRNLQRRLGTKRSRAAKAYLAVEELEPRTVPSAAVTPNDPSFSAQWDLQAARLPKAWSVSTGSTKTTVAVIDSGVDYDHPDLFENIWINQKEIPLSRLKNLKDVDGDGLITFYDLNNALNKGAGKITDVNHDGRIDAADILAPMVLDNKGNDTRLGGWAHNSTQDGDTLHPDDLVGWNFVANSNNPFDDLGHGTHVAGTIGAMGNDGIGVAGINWSIQIMALKFIDANGAGTITGAADALNYAVAHGATITNNSWSGGGNYPPFAQALQNAQAHGVIFVAAAGNSGLNMDVSPSYPASYKFDNVVAVAATDQNNNLASWSDYGAASVQLAAPGVSILSTTPYGNYRYYSGTSMAAPHVSGVLALLKSVHPDWTYKQLIARVLQTVDPVAGLKGKVVTGGLLDAAAALAMPPAAPPAASKPPVAYAPGSPGVNFVTHLYSDVLGRAPDAGGLRSWLHALDSGMSRAQVARAFWESIEHRGHEIDADYVQLLHHHVDSVHLRQWLQVFQNGGNETDLLRGILTGDEYTAGHAGATSYVNGIYLDLLGRSPSAGEFATEVQKLLFRWSRASVAQDVLGSAEYLRDEVQADYGTFVRHRADAAAEHWYVIGLSNGSQTAESLAVNLLASDEYYRRR